MYHPDITVETFMPDAREAVTLHGLGQFEEFVRDWLTQWQAYRVTGEDFQEVGADKVSYPVGRSQLATAAELQSIRQPSPSGYSVKARW